MPESDPEHPGLGDDGRWLVLGSATGGLAGSVAAAFAALCCVGPSAVALLGVGGALAAATLGPYRALLLIVSLALIGFGFRRAYWPRVYANEGAACPVRAGRMVRGVLWLSAVTWLVAALLPTT